MGSTFSFCCSKNTSTTLEDQLVTPYCPSLFTRRDFIRIDNPIRIRDDYEILRKLGAGSFADVRLARNRKTGLLEVVKRIKIIANDRD